MTQHRIKRTDQEWFDLIRDCRASSLKVSDWCGQHCITVKALYYHTRRLRQKGYAIPQKNAESDSQEKQEVVRLDISHRESPDRSLQSHFLMESGIESAICIDFHGIRIGIANHAAQDTILHTFQALQGLC